MEWARQKWNEWARHAWRVAVAGILLYGLHLAILIEHHGRVAAENSQWMRNEFQATAVQVAAETKEAKQRLQIIELEVTSAFRAMHGQAVRWDRLLERMLAIAERGDAHFEQIAVAARQWNALGERLHLAPVLNWLTEDGTDKQRRHQR